VYDATSFCCYSLLLRQPCSASEITPGDPNIPPEVMAGWVDDQQHLLYKAYFSQGATQAENDAHLARENAKYKITVKDPDFFAGAAKP